MKGKIKQLLINSVKDDGIRLMTTVADGIIFTRKKEMKRMCEILVIKVYEYQSTAEAA